LGSELAATLCDSFTTFSQQIGQQIGQQIAQQFALHDRPGRTPASPAHPGPNGGTPQAPAQPNPNNPNGNPEPVHIDQNQFTDLKWRPRDIGFFDPTLDESLGTGDCVVVGANIYWRDVHLFTDRIQDNTVSERAPVVRQNLVTCLRGSALAWYTRELDDL
jgi:hypothetical protein